MIRRAVAHAMGVAAEKVVEETPAALDAIPEEEPPAAAADALPEEPPVDAPVEEPAAAADAPVEEPAAAADVPEAPAEDAVLEERPAADAVVKEPAAAALPVLGKLTPDPAKESRDEFLKRVQRAHKCKLAIAVQKVKAVPGLWELWPEDAPIPAVPQKRKAAQPAQPRPKAAVAEPAPKRGRPGTNADLKDRLLAGGELESLEEYERVPALIKLAGQQRTRLLKAGNTREAEHVQQTTVTLFQAADRWADANEQPRIRRVQQLQRNNDALFRTGMEMITAAHRLDNHLLTEELRRQERRGE